MVTLPVKCLWLASGNNVQMARELIRRTLWSRLDPKVDAPGERAGPDGKTKWKHPNLKLWMRENRSRLVIAAVTLCKSWIEAGCKRGDAVMGMFEDWAGVMSGILDNSGVPGLLANRREFRAERADQADEWREFIAAWWTNHAMPPAIGEPATETVPVGTSKLFDLVIKEKLLDRVIGDEGERSQRTKLGNALKKNIDRCFTVETIVDTVISAAQYQIVRVKNDHSGCQQLKLTWLQTQTRQQTQT